MKCKGIETSTNDFIEIKGDSVISHVDPVLEAADNASLDRARVYRPSGEWIRGRGLQFARRAQLGRNCTVHPRDVFDRRDALLSRP